MKSEVTFPPTLSNDLIEEILLKLPIKSVLRFKCVCKSWLSLISNPQFAKSHYNVAAAPTHRFLNLINNYEIKAIDTDSAFDDDSKEVVFKIPLPSLYCKFIVGSCRGFILLTTNAYCTTFIDFLIWNPSTGLVKHIMPINYDPYDPYTCSPLCGIGYDSSTDDYAVVVVTLLQRLTVIKYFSLRTNSWSFSKCTTPYYIPDSTFSCGVFLNRALHWLVEYSCDHHHHVIIAFDIWRKRRLLNIPVPHHLAIIFDCEIYHLSIMRDCLCICVKKHTMLEIWMMKEYKVQSSWTKLFVMSSLCDPFDFIYPICFIKNGEILGTDGGKILARFNDKGELLEHRKGEQHRDSVLIMYRESLLSLPGEFGKPSQDEQHHFITINEKCKVIPRGVIHDVIP